MDTSTSDIAFDQSGTCSFCNDFLQSNEKFLAESPIEREIRLEELVRQVKKASEGKKYDCIVGVSGGVDSSWALIKIVELGLKPLAVHMDNGWNSELAQNNIANLIRALGVDLYTHVINWGEYKSLMEAFFSADVINVELLYDNAMLAVNFQQAKRFGIRYILAGTNQATEGLKMPIDWNWFNFDKKNILAIARSAGLKSFKSFPSIGVNDYLSCRYLKKIRWVSFLDYLDYVKEDAVKHLTANYGYKPYPYKHYESIFTRFYQGYILPQKFGVDKRRLHLSNLIVSGQLSREKALKVMEDIPYESLTALNQDTEYFLKKMSWSQTDLNEYISRPEVPHAKFPNEKIYWDLIFRIWQSMGPSLKNRIRNL